ncbi:helix-turn-helix domain-containing protein [Dactylosporangium matsuzakiense]|uniref:DNA-binding protein n=1 Tax=Dactylosporangium matsuzakiense TaxID=53360 RepID=A0A9W6KUR7_9ACTN|nr:helix-turn-helix transcriptional regulator [Dactylosporangium matsuzakiense]UWZ41184.1 helix-turn-helix domain-containing protein [Dactylosporangium matsuzakiense]GLL08476.1 DNA-binding protein [Dactylosporangium matsuzakiense]
MDRRTELAEFLRSRRARIDPEAAGVPPYHGRRRVQGLRREEVAQLAGVSVDYYVRLEQGRAANVSAAVLDAVARALHLDADERAHLRRLTRPVRGVRRPASPQRVRPQVRHLLAAMSDAAAYVVGRRTDVLAWNRLGGVLFTDLDALPVRQRNFARLMFGDEAAGAAMFADWPAKARDLVAFLHVDAGRHPDDPALAELVGELSVHSARFRRLWADHPVHDKGHTTAVVRHPLTGPIELAYEALRLPDDPDQILVTYSAAPDSEAATALRLLASWHAAPR